MFPFRKAFGVVLLALQVLFWLLGFDCGISTSSKKRIADKLEELNIVGLSRKSIVGVAQFLNPYIRGWIN
ncbi:hypothetical protein [Mangrovibacterium marinum]|uniref:hypothetical protein n=1 Tax=Mangrovibacterium marinum TaxID=1639118 RepID=UPI002A189277|nr:hypothetical protein [Mangrovibacterium marinum]